jgi:hypothetical protein
MELRLSFSFDKLVIYNLQEFKQNTLFNFDFLKAYDQVVRAFIFQVLERIGITKAFINIVKLLFEGIEAIVNVNGASSCAFPNQCRVKQGCLVTLYIFLLVSEAFNQAIKHVVHVQEMYMGHIKSIRLSNRNI